MRMYLLLDCITRIYMKYLAFGRSKLRVSEYCLGCLTMGKLQANLSIEDGAGIITTAARLGINFIDTAENYGNAGQIKRAIAILKAECPGLLGQMVFATKTKVETGLDMERFVSGSLDDFSRPALDLVCMHNIPDEKGFQKREGAFFELLELKDRGIVREIGWTAHSLRGLDPVLDHAGDFGVVMPVVNFKGTGLRGHTLDDLAAFLRRARRKNLSVYSMKSLGGGHLRDEVDEAIAWLRNNPLVDVACIGAKSTSEVIYNAHVFNDEPVPEAVKCAIERVPRALIIYHHLCQKCGCCAKACTSGAMTFSELTGPVVDRDACMLCGYCADACPKFIIRIA